jgi:hypothetical protein
MITQPPPKHESPPSRVFVNSPNGVRYCVSTGFRESSALNGPRWYYETMLFRISGDRVLGFDDQADAYSAAAAEANRDRLASQAAAGQYDS